MEKQNNVPKLRFPEFSDGWEMKKLGEVAAIYDGTHQTPNYVNSGVKFVSVENINDIENTNKFISTDAFEKEYKIKPKKDDILMTRITAGIIGATAVVKNNDQLGYYVSLALIRIKNDYDVNFLCQRIESREFKKELHKRIIHVAFPKKINLGDISDCNVYYTTLPEQKKIATFLSSVDEKLQALKKKKSLLEQYKKGIMQKIFSQELRFKDDKGNEFEDWEEKTLGEIFTFKLTNSFSRDNLNYVTGMVKNIHYGDIHTKFQTLFDINKEVVPYINPTITIDRISEENYCKEGDIVFADASEDLNDVGKSIEIFNLNNEKLLSGLHTLLARPFQGKLSIGFGGYLFKSENVRLQIQKEAQGSKVLSISATRISSIQLPLPPLGEQTKITNFLMIIDEKINKVNLQIKQMELWKKGLLQQIFV